MAHLSIDERFRIYEMNKEGYSSRSIGAALNRDKSTVCYELRKVRGHYRPDVAHTMSISYRKNKKQRKLDLDANLRQSIVDQLKSGIAPDVISGRRKLGFENGGKIMVRLESEQTSYHECNRLVCNMIVYYNSYILSQFLLEKSKRNQSEQIEALKQVSPIAWRHINFYGKYNFTPSKDDHLYMEKINNILASITLI